ncbi:hypothetical protein [Streptomyces sp. WMMC897]|uniref:hypothetical protein n=1 Tax=Streptomyces sp. WMMC897 TaxID=3014782 RepID=UPI0022B6B223|nr:hypothetical protein [Streptomyces sp. WMMC897]MCZ7417396.1 hypothetical protein [Streptomyces sp. WMMC897]
MPAPGCRGAARRPAREPAITARTAPRPWPRFRARLRCPGGPRVRPRVRVPLGRPGEPRPRGRARRLLLVLLLCVGPLLGGGAVACTTAQKLTTALRLQEAVERLGRLDTASVTARLDAEPDAVLAYLRQRAGAGADGERLREQARLLADLEVAVAVRAEGHLRDLSPGDRVDLAASVGFGGEDVLGLVTVDEQLHLRFGLSAMAAETRWRGPVLRDAPELEALADELPSALHSVRAALRGAWVRVEAAEFGEFAEALGGRPHAPAERIARSTTLLTSDEVRQHLVGAVRDVLTTRGALRDAGERGGVRHLTVTLPAGDAARALAAALEPIRYRVGDPDLGAAERVPDRPVELDLALRDGALSSLTVDLARLDPRAPDGPGAATLPLRLEFAPGQVARVAAPHDAPRLRPQDLLAALTYADLHEPRLASLLRTLRTLDLE